MTTLNITTGSITVADPISASYAQTASVALNAMPSINGMAYFTSSTVWTVPIGIKNVRVIAIGAGGGGSGGPTGGGGGGYAEGIVSVDGYSTLFVTVGMAGTGGGGFSEGGTGGTSGLLSLSASGGKGGKNGGDVVAGGTGISSSISGNGGSGSPAGGGIAGNLPWILVTTSSMNINAIGCGGYGDSVAGNPGAVVIYY